MERAVGITISLPIHEGGLYLNFSAKLIFVCIDILIRALQIIKTLVNMVDGLESY